MRCIRFVGFCAPLAVLAALSLEATTEARAAAPAPASVAKREARASSAAARRSPPSQSPRLVPPLYGTEVATLGAERDGTRRLVAYGLRVLAAPDAKIELSEEFFPTSRNVQALELPARFGSGFLFWVVGSGRTSLWKTKTWTSPLLPFAELDFELERLVPGFDRLYVQARRTAEWAALDAQSGAGLDSGSLPRSPNFGVMAFADEWFGAVELPVRGPVVSFDAGASWHPLGSAALSFAAANDELMIVTSEGRQLLASDGSLRALEQSVPMGAALEDLRRVQAEGLLGPFPLRSAVLRGALDGPGSAVLLTRGALGRVRLEDGSVLAVRPRVLPEASECTALELGASLGFVCGEPRGATDLYALSPGLTLQRVEHFDSPRAVSASGNGALVIRGGCGVRETVGQRVHCIRTPGGSRFEVPMAGEAGVERVVALRDERAAVLIPPRLGVPGSLLLVNARGQRVKLPLKLDSRDRAASTLFSNGFWLDGFVQSGDGSLSGWVQGHGVFAGVRVTLDGHAKTGPLQRSIERALVSGERALVVPAAGIAEQSVDGGQSWTDVDLPTDIELDPARMALSGGGLEQGCSSVGCAFLGWLRVGWDRHAGGKPLRVARAPKPTSLPMPGGGRWILRCAPTGEVSKAALVTTARPERRLADPETRPNWLPFVERPAPPLPKESVGFDFGNDGQLRAYAWAPRGADFGKAGLVALSVVDRYDIHHGVWSTRPSPSPWQDSAYVAEVFGVEGSSSPSFRLALDPSGRAGVLGVTARGLTDLFSVEEGRSLERLVNASREGIGGVTSMVRLGSTAYVMAQEDARAVRVFALEAQRGRLVGQYPDVATGRSAAPSLVRSTRGDALAIWARGAGWYVFPLNPTTGAVERAIEVTARELSVLPRACNPDEEGFLLEGAISVEPYVELLGVAERVSARAFEGRFVVNQAGVCVKSLLAQSDGTFGSELLTGKRVSSALSRVPLVVVDRTSGGRRWGFRCGG